MKLLAVQVLYGCVAYLAHVVWQYLAAQTYCDALCSLSQQERELDGQRDRLLVAAVVRELPLCGLGVEDYVECEF